MKATGKTPHICETLGSLWLAHPDATSAVCAKLTANMGHQQWPDWVSPDIDDIKVCPDLPVPAD